MAYTLYKLSFGDDDFVYFGITEISLVSKLEYVKNDLRFYKYTGLGCSIMPLKENMGLDEAFYEEFKIITENFENPKMLNTHVCSSIKHCVRFYIFNVAPKEHQKILFYLLKTFLGDTYDKNKKDF